MQRVVPSDVVRLIRKVFTTPRKDGRFELSIANVIEVRTLLRVLDRMEEKFIALPAEQFAVYQASLETLRHALHCWESDNVELRKRTFDTTPGFLHGDPVNHLILQLSQCPDEVPSADEARGFEFVGDEELRNNFRSDQAIVDRAHANGEWKAATVLAGSLLEALLLWRLRQEPLYALGRAIETAVASKSVSKPKPDLVEWHLHEMIEVCQVIGALHEDTVKSARLAKDFRNFIHPGKEVRLERRCGRGEALDAMAAVEHVKRDLAR